MGFPRVSETFISSELLRVEQAGVPMRLFVVKPVEERERLLRHPVVDAIQARPEHLPDAASLTKPLHLWRRADLAPFLPAIKRVARRRPTGLARALATATAQAIRDRRTRFSGPRKIYIKELLQAIALADRVLQAPDVRHLHAHFAHGTTTITWHAATSPASRSASPATPATSTPSTSTRRGGSAASCSPRASSSPAPRRTSSTSARSRPRRRSTSSTTG